MRTAIRIIVAFVVVVLTGSHIAAQVVVRPPARQPPVRHVETYPRPNLDRESVARTTDMLLKNSKTLSGSLRPDANQSWIVIHPETVAHYCGKGTSRQQDQAALGLRADLAGKVSSWGYNLRGFAAKQEAIQTVLERVTKNCARILLADNPGGYISELAKNAVTDLLRKENRVREIARQTEGVPAAGNSLGAVVGDTSPDPARAVEAMDIVRKLQISLTERQLQVLMAMLEDKDTTDIAKELNISADGVRDVRERIRIQFTKLISAAEAAPK